MQIVHYIHLNKYWYYWLDNSTQKRYFRKFRNLSDMYLVSEEIITEKEVKIILQKLFPDKEIIKAIAFHSSPSEKGSRPKKKTIDRKIMLKEKVMFKEELSMMYRNDI